MGVFLKIEKSTSTEPGPVMLAMRAFPKVNGAGVWKALVLNHSLIVLGPLFGLPTTSGSAICAPTFGLSKVRMGVSGCPDAAVTIPPSCQPETILLATAGPPDQKRCPLPIGSAYNQLSVKRFRWSF